MFRFEPKVNAHRKLNWAGHVNHLASSEPPKPHAPMIVGAEIKQTINKGTKRTYCVFLELYFATVLHLFCDPSYHTFAIVRLFKLLLYVSHKFASVNMFPGKQYRAMALLQKRHARQLKRRHRLVLLKRSQAFPFILQSASLWCPYQSHHQMQIPCRQSHHWMS